MIEGLREERKMTADVHDAVTGTRSDEGVEDGDNMMRAT